MSTTHEVTVRARQVVTAEAARAAAAAWGCDPRALAGVFAGGSAVLLKLAVACFQADVAVVWEATEVARLLVHTHGRSVPLEERLPELFEQHWTLTPERACFAFVAGAAGECTVLMPAELAPPTRLRRWEAIAWPGCADACLNVFPPPAGAASLEGGIDLLPHEDGQDFGLARATFSPDGTLLATGGEHGTVALWRTADLQEVARITEDFQEEGDPAPFVQFAADGAALLWSSLDGDGLRRRSVGAEGETERVEGAFYRYAICPDGQTLVAQTGAPGLALVEVATGALRGTIAPGAGGEDRTNFAVARRGGLVAVATREQSVEVRTLPAGERLWAWPLPAEELPPELAFSRDGERLAVGRPAGVIAVVEARSGRIVREIPTLDPALAGVAATIVMSVDFSPDGAWLAVAVCERYAQASSSQVWIVRVADGVVLRKLGAPSRELLRVEFAPGPLLLVQRYDHVTVHRISPAARG